MTKPTFDIDFYAIAVSTSCARTRIVLDHKGLAYTEVPPPQGYATEAYKTLIPAGTVPGLVLKNPDKPVQPFALSDSVAQCNLLDELFPEPAMMPSAGPAEQALLRAKILSVASFHDVRLEPAVRALFPLLKPKTEIDQVAAKQACDLLQQRLDLLDAVCDPKPYLGGDLFTHADAAFPSTLHMGKDIAEALGHNVRFSEKISAWLNAMEQVPAVEKTLNLNRPALKTWIESKQ